MADIGQCSALQNLSAAPNICEISLYTSTCEGGSDMIILVENVVEGDVQVIFYSKNWRKRAKIRRIHHNCAIVLVVPQYEDQEIESDIKVFFKLERLSDGISSESREFRYTPKNLFSNVIEIYKKLETPMINFDDVLNSEHDRKNEKNSNELDQNLISAESNHRTRSTDISSSMEVDERYMDQDLSDFLDDLINYPESNQSQPSFSSETFSSAHNLVLDGPGAQLQSRETKMKKRKSANKNETYCNQLMKNKTSDLQEQDVPYIQFIIIILIIVSGILILKDVQFLRDTTT